MKLSVDERRRIAAAHPDDADIQKLLKAAARADALLERALWEFGGDLRADIERYLGERPLLPTR